MKIPLLLLVLASPALAQQADGGVSDAELQKELEQAIQSDKSAAQKQGQGQPAPPASTEAAPPPASAAPQTLARGTQTLNPDISAILDADFGVQRRAPQFLNGDDPDLHASSGRHALGFTAQEVELAFSAIVD